MLDLYVDLRDAGFRPRSPADLRGRDADAILTQDSQDLAAKGACIMGRCHALHLQLMYQFARLHGTS